MGKQSRAIAKRLSSRSRHGRLVVRKLHYLRSYYEIASSRLYFGLTTKTPSEYFPTFLCVGAQKAGTSWLDSTLRYHPDVQMPIDRKELHFFDSGLWKGVDWYGWNYRRTNRKIRGDITPAYSVLSIDRVRLIKETIGSPIIAIILRDPVDRAWSMAYMDLVRDPGKSINTLSNDVFYKHFLSEKSRKRGAYSEIIKNYRRVFGEEKVKVLFYDEMSSDPKKFFYEFLAMIGASHSRMPIFTNFFDRINEGGVSIPERYKDFLTSLYWEELQNLGELISLEYQPDWLRGI